MFFSSCVVHKKKHIEIGLYSIINSPRVWIPKGVGKKSPQKNISTFKYVLNWKFLSNIIGCISYAIKKVEYL